MSGIITSTAAGGVFLGRTVKLTRSTEETRCRHRIRATSQFRWASDF